MTQRLDRRKLATAVKRNPQLSQSGLAKQLGTSQATISRALKDLGFARGLDGRLQGLADGPGAYGSRRRIAPQGGGVSAFVASLELVGQFAVVKTTDGGAQMVGARLDSACLPWIIATVGGRDALLIILRGSTEEIVNRLFPALTVFLLDE